MKEYRSATVDIFLNEEKTAKVVMRKPTLSAYENLKGLKDWGKVAEFLSQLVVSVDGVVIDGQPATLDFSWPLELASEVLEKYFVEITRSVDSSGVGEAEKN